MYSRFRVLLFCCVSLQVSYAASSNITDISTGSSGINATNGTTSKNSSLDVIPQGKSASTVKVVEIASGSAGNGSVSSTSGSRTITKKTTTEVSEEIIDVNDELRNDSNFTSGLGRSAITTASRKSASTGDSSSGSTRKTSMTRTKTSQTETTATAGETEEATVETSSSEEGNTGTQFELIETITTKDSESENESGKTKNSRTGKWKSSGGEKDRQIIRRYKIEEIKEGSGATRDKSTQKWEFRKGGVKKIDTKNGTEKNTKGGSDTTNAKKTADAKRTTDEEETTDAKKTADAKRTTDEEETTDAKKTAKVIPTEGDSENRANKVIEIRIIKNDGEDSGSSKLEEKITKILTEFFHTKGNESIDHSGADRTQSSKLEHSKTTVESTDEDDSAKSSNIKEESRKISVDSSRKKSVADESFEDENSEESLEQSDEGEDDKGQYDPEAVKSSTETTEREMATNEGRKKPKAGDTKIIKKITTVDELTKTDTRSKNPSKGGRSVTSINTKVVNTDERVGEGYDPTDKTETEAKIKRTPDGSPLRTQQEDLTVQEFAARGKSKNTATLTDTDKKKTTTSKHEERINTGSANSDSSTGKNFTKKVTRITKEEWIDSGSDRTNSKDGSGEDVRTFEDFNSKGKTSRTRTKVNDEEETDSQSDEGSTHDSGEIKSTSKNVTEKVTTRSKSQRDEMNRGKRRKGYKGSGNDDAKKSWVRKSESKTGRKTKTTTNNVSNGNTEDGKIFSQEQAGQEIATENAERSDVSTRITSDKNSRKKDRKNLGKGSGYDEEATEISEGGKSTISKSTSTTLSRTRSGSKKSKGNRRRWSEQAASGMGYRRHLDRDRRREWVRRGRGNYQSDRRHFKRHHHSGRHAWKHYHNEDAPRYRNRGRGWRRYYFY